MLHLVWNHVEPTVASPFLEPYGCSRNSGAVLWNILSGTQLLMFLFWKQVVNSFCFRTIWLISCLQKPAACGSPAGCVWIVANPRGRPHPHRQTFPPGPRGLAVLRACRKRANGGELLVILMIGYCHRKRRRKNTYSAHCWFL